MMSHGSDLYILGSVLFYTLKLYLYLLRLNTVSGPNKGPQVFRSVGQNLKHMA